MNSLSCCRDGFHKLEEIYRDQHSCAYYDQIVNWCSVCGSVVVDAEVDNRISPGYIMKMRSPEITKGG